MKSTRLLLILALAVVLGLAAGYSALRYLGDRPTPVVPTARREVVPVVLAAQDLPLGTILEDSHLKTVDWPAGAVPPGFAGTREELVGRSLITDVRTNEAILASKLADSGLRGLIPLIPPGKRAVSVRVDDVVSVAGFVTPQTKVDIILVMKPQGSDDTVSKVILQNVQALASGQQIRETEDGQAITVNVLTVLVTPEEAEKLALAAQEGHLRMALRNTLDLEQVETAGERASRLFAGAGPAQARPTARTGTTAPTTQESIIEIYRGGVRTLIAY